MKYVYFLLLMLLILPFSSILAQDADESDKSDGEDQVLLTCGTERWAVKTCIDADTVNINFNNIVASSVAYQRGLPAVTLPGDNVTRLAREDTVYSLDCMLIETKIEADQDYHVVISTIGNASETMDAEICNPGCPSIANTSRFTALTNLFSWYQTWVGTPSSYKTINTPVHITGVGFYDFSHGSTGAAPQSTPREIHPVLTMSIITLPVELSSFTYKAVNNSIKLEWETKTEISNNRFEIERKDGTPYWYKIGDIKAAGNSNSAKQYYYLDSKLPSNGKYYYRLKQVDNDGQEKYSGEIAVDVNFIPNVYSLENNFPNPFNPSTVIRYSIPVESNVKLNVYNSLGQVVVNELTTGIKQAGTYDINFNAYTLKSGIYYYTLHANSTDGKHNFTATKKMIYLK